MRGLAKKQTGPPTLVVVPKVTGFAKNKPAVRDLHYKGPFDWNSLLSVFRAHQLPHLETVDDEAYERVVKTSLGLGLFRVVHHSEQQALRLFVWNGSNDDVERIAMSARRMFDLDADPAVISQAMKGDGVLSKIWTRHPGLRVARSWNGFESLVTTILGQLVSVRFGRVLADELMTAAGARGRHPKTNVRIHLFPSAKRILTADLSSVRTSKRRITAIRDLATLVAEGALDWESSLAPDELRKTLLAVDGIGVWTSEYTAMRGFNDNDAFPRTDYGLKQALKHHSGIDVNRVRPWRAYAATALWTDFSKMKDSQS